MPEIETLEIDTVCIPTVTVKDDAAGLDIVSRFALNVRRKLSPVTTADESVGPCCTPFVTSIAKLVTALLVESRSGVDASGV